MRKRSGIDLRDAYVLPWEGKYYLYGTEGFGAFTGTPRGFLCYVSDDLENWDGPFTVFANDGGVWADTNYWAPEVYALNGSFYLFAAWASKAALAASQPMGEGSTPESRQRLAVLKAAHPLGPFAVVNADLGPGNDPTLYEEGGRHYLVHNDGFTHMQAHLLREDLSAFEGPAIPLFSREDPEVFWSVGGPTEGAETFVTPTGRLIVLWSSFCRGSAKNLAAMGFPDMDYGTAIAWSEGGIRGPFHQENRLMMPANMGHVNLFTALDGRLMLATHWPDDNTNALGCSTPVFFPVEYDADADTLRVLTEDAMRKYGEE